MKLFLHDDIARARLRDAQRLLCRACRFAYEMLDVTHPPRIIEVRSYARRALNMHRYDGIETDGNVRNVSITGASRTDCLARNMRFRRCVEVDIAYLRLSRSTTRAFGNGICHGANCCDRRLTAFL